MITQPENKKRITNILVECPALIPSVKVGVLDVLHPLMKEGKCNVQFVPTMSIRAKHIKWCDVLITVRGGETATLNIVRTAKKYGRFVVYYLDDDLLNVPVGNENERLYYNLIVKNNLPKVIGLSDCLWGVNPNIRKKYISFCKSGRWIENKVPMQLCEEQEDRKENESINILFAGSKGHEGLLKELLVPIVETIVDEFENKVTFTFIGADSGIYDRNNVRNIAYFENYDQYRKAVMGTRYDIGLAVTRDEPFYHCKYYNKFLEYTSIGCVGIYTKAEPYTLVIENRKNGYLCSNKQEAWEKTIRNAILNHKERMICIDNARKYIAENHDIESVIKKLVKDIPELLFYRAVEVKGFFTINIRFFYVLDRIRQMILGYGWLKGTGMIFVKVLKKIACK